MKDRIKLIMDSEHLAPSEFADKLQIGRAVISHILNGRNNPSLDVVTRILTNFKEINPDWLLGGTGQMHKSERLDVVNTTANNFDLFSSPNITNGTDLFSQNDLNNVDVRAENKYAKENIVNAPKNDIQTEVIQSITHKKAIDKKVVKIIIYYSDNTFETFNADNKPL